MSHSQIGYGHNMTISDGCFHQSGMITVAPRIDARTLERLFKHHVLMMLLGKGKIAQDIIALLNNGNIPDSTCIVAKEFSPAKVSMENLARYIIRTPLLIPRNPAINRSSIQSDKSNDYDHNS